MCLGLRRCNRRHDVHVQVKILSTHLRRPLSSLRKNVASLASAQNSPVQLVVMGPVQSYVFTGQAPDAHGGEREGRRSSSVPSDGVVLKCNPRSKSSKPRHLPGNERTDAAAPPKRGCRSCGHCTAEKSQKSTGNLPVGCITLAPLPFHSPDPLAPGPLLASRRDRSRPLHFPLSVWSSGKVATGLIVTLVAPWCGGAGPPQSDLAQGNVNGGNSPVKHWRRGDRRATRLQAANATIAVVRSDAGQQPFARRPALTNRAALVSTLIGADAQSQIKLILHHYHLPSQSRVHKWNDECPCAVGKNLCDPAP
jgi:hypothetical protein